MFIFQDTGKPSQHREKQRKVVIEARRVTYLELHPKTGDLIKSNGLEIVKEIVVSSDFPEQAAIAVKIVDSKTIDNTVDENGNLRVKKQYNRYND